MFVDAALEVDCVCLYTEIVLVRIVFLYGIRLTATTDSEVEKCGMHCRRHLTPCLGLLLCPLHGRMRNTFCRQTSFLTSLKTPPQLPKVCSGRLPAAQAGLPRRFSTTRVIGNESRNAQVRYQEHRQRRGLLYGAQEPIQALCTFC